MAQSLPSTIDPGRVEKFFDPNLQKFPDTQEEQQNEFVSEPPAGAENVKFVLKEVRITGMSKFSDADFKQIYQPFLNTEITLNLVWNFAAQITNMYKKQGYFLSRAFIPKQEIDNGFIKIEVYEGYLSEIVFPEADQIGIRNIHRYMNQILMERPTRFSTLESFLLLLNDLPGHRFRSYIEPAVDPSNGKNTSKVIISREIQKKQSSLLWDISGSDLVGKNIFRLAHSGSYLPSGQTEIVVLAASPNGELTQYSLSQSFPIDLKTSIELALSRTTVSPGGSLEELKIEGNSISLDLAAVWKIMRTRQENLNLTIGIPIKTTRSDILDNVALVRERVRAISTKLHYDLTQSNRIHSVDIGLTKGLQISGNSKISDTGLSRANADPDFTIFNLDYMLTQQLSKELNLIWALSAQLATTPLHSFNEFGYGGSEYGRAYNSSQITGDHGVSTRLELRHTGFRLPLLFSQLVPYSFYDTGRVWNINDATDLDESASSFGVGGYLSNQKGFDVNLGYAFRNRVHLSDSQNIENTRSGRVLFQFNLRF